MDMQMEQPTRVNTNRTCTSLSTIRGVYKDASATVHEEESDTAYSDNTVFNNSKQPNVSVE